MRIIITAAGSLAAPLCWLPSPVSEVMDSGANIWGDAAAWSLWACPNAMAWHRCTLRRSLDASGGGTRWHPSS